MTSARRLEQIDALRALAIGCVLLMHAGHYSGLNASPLGAFTGHLNIGVPIFFLLSGFVLYRPFVAALLASAEPPSLVRYAVRRALRLLPAYWLALGVLSLWPGLWGMRLAGPWPYITLAQSFHPDWYFGGIPAAWSLSVEWAFSALLPLLVMATRALAAQQTPARQAARAAALSVGLGLVGLAVRGVGRAALSPIADTVLGHLFYFALGMLLAVSATARAQGVWSSSRTFGGATLGAAGVLYLAHCAVIPVGNVTQPLSPWLAVGDQLTSGAVALLLALPAVHGAAAATGVQRLLRAPRLVTLGLWSYGMFLWHQPPLARVAGLGWGLEPPLAFAVLALALLPFATLLGWLSHRFVEQPSLRLAERWIAALGRATGENAPRPLDLLALATITAVTLAQQVATTRMFGVVLAYHFSYLAISVALLGTGAGALLVYLRPGWFAAPTRVLLSRVGAALALALGAFAVLFCRLHFGTGRSLDAPFVLNLSAACVLAAVPALASGVLVALALDRFRAQLGFVYAADLIGAALGALIVVPLLGLGAPSSLVLALAGVTALAALGFARTRPALAALALTGLAFGAAQVTALTRLPFGFEATASWKVISERWTPITRSFGVELAADSDFALLVYDRVYAPVPVVRSERLPDYARLVTGPASVGFAFRGPGRALVIGGGGGRDIYTALSEGQTVDVIELSDGNRRVVDQDLGQLSGRPYARAHTVIGDGRSELAARSKRYDQIHIGFTDTLSANAAAGFALLENNLYTLEAFDLYYDHLAPRGLLNVSRLIKLVGDEALRVTVLTLEALARRGVADPFAHVVVVGGSDLLGPPMATVLSRLEPFSAEEIARLGKLARQRGRGLLMAPGRPAREQWQRLAELHDARAFCTTYPLDVCAPTDDRPFFFNMGRLGALGQAAQPGYHYSQSPLTLLVVTLAILVVLAAAAVLWPLGALPRQLRLPLAEVGYFGCIGFGFLFVELVFVQRFVLLLGYPTYAFSVVLFALLLSSGIGALYSGRWTEPRVALGATVWLVTAYAALLPALGPLLMPQPFLLRAACCVAVVAPCGFAMSMAMPLGLARVARAHPQSFAFAWGINGVASVLASVAGAFVSVQWGFTATTLLGAGWYALAYGCARAASGAAAAGATPAPASAA